MSTASTIDVEKVAKIFCDLGIKIANHFELDETKVAEYLDALCHDKLGVEPGVEKELDRRLNPPQVESCKYVFCADDIYTRCDVSPRKGKQFCSRHIQSLQAQRYLARRNS